MALVLIVDDSESDRQLASKVVSKAGHQVMTVSSGKDALSLLKTQRPDLILLDIVMPEVDGFKTCRSVRDLPGLERVPIILVTSKQSPSDQFWGKKQGATDHLGKPYKPKELSSLIDKYIV